MEGKVAVLGDADFVMPFSALGLDTFAVEEQADQISQAAEQITKAGYSLILAAENIAGFVEEIFAQQQKKTLPAIVIVPFTADPTGAATKSLGQTIKMAAGIDILKNA